MMSKKTILISLACVIGAGILFSFIAPYILVPFFGYGSDPRNTSVEDRLQDNLMRADRTPGWTADGQSIVANIGHGIYVVNTSDLSLRRILPKRSGQYYSPSLSRTGRVAYIHHEFVRPAVFRPAEDSRYHVETVDLTSDKVQRIRWTYHEMRPPLISPDGSRIWIAASGTRIYDNQGRVASPFEDHALGGIGVWSNDGQRISYVRGALLSNSGHYWSELVVADWQGNGEVIVAEAKVELEVDNALSVGAWSPDDKRLYYAQRSSTTDGPTTLNVADLDSGATTTIAELGRGVDVQHISASPDGSALLLVTLTYSITNQVWTIDTDGTHMRKIAGDVHPKDTWPSARRLYASWSPGGNRIAIYNSEETSLYTLEPDGSNVKVLVAGDPAGN